MIPCRRMVCALATVLGLGALAEAGVTYSFSGTVDGKSVSALADVTFEDDKLTIELTNTTGTTYSAAQLLTGFRFSVDSLSGTTSLTAASTDAGRTVDKDGNYTDSAGVDLLDVDGSGSPTWELSSESASLLLSFHPDAAYAILGVPDSDGTYGHANGSIQGNGGKNPFAAESATFVLSNSNFTSSTRLSNVEFGWGTDIVFVPLPPAAWTGLGLLGALGVVRWRRRRRSA